MGSTCAAAARFAEIFEIVMNNRLEPLIAEPVLIERGWQRVKDRVAAMQAQLESGHFGSGYGYIESPNSW